MLRRARPALWRRTIWCMQGWGSTGGGGWGSPSGVVETGGGWGEGHHEGGSSSRTSSMRGGWGDEGGGGGRARRGWDAGPSRWSDGDAGWRGARPGRGGRGGGSFRRGRAAGFERRGGAGAWGQPAPAADEDAWGAAPPSFSPPVRRVDPLTLTAVEVEIDGVRKLVGQRVQISGLSDDTSWQTLKDHLRQVAEVTFCKIFSGGRAMVEFTTPEDAARAITELQGSELEGATMFLREDRDDTVLVNTRRKIREAREAQLRAQKEQLERTRYATAIAQGDTQVSAHTNSPTPSAAAQAQHETLPVEEGAAALHSKNEKGAVVEK